MSPPEVFEPSNFFSTLFIANVVYNQTPNGAVALKGESRRAKAKEWARNRGVRYLAIDTTPQLCSCNLVFVDKRQSRRFLDAQVVKYQQYTTSDDQQFVSGKEMCCALFKYSIKGVSKFRSQPDLLVPSLPQMG